MEIRRPAVLLVVSALVPVLPACRDEGGPAAPPRMEAEFQGGGAGRVAVCAPCLP